jgi:Putative mono-oxygenase ydhR
MKTHTLAMASLSAATVFAQTPAPVVSTEPLTQPSQIVTIVTVPKPWYAPRALVASKMRDTQIQYESMPGLHYKIYTLAQADGQFGGIYLWKDRAAAQTWFAPSWFERVRKERGVGGVVRYFDAPLMLDNTPGGTPLNARSASVATLVTIPLPAGVTREKVIAEFNAALPTYQRVPGLLRKYFILTSDGRLGGVYLWDKQASADQWFSEAWQQRVRNTYGAAATMEWFDAPILLPTKAKAAL